MFKDLRKLKELYDSGENILAYIKEEVNKNENSSIGISISYDLQAGSYIKKAKKNKKFEIMRAKIYANIIDKLGEFDSIAEVGIGEATTFSNLLPLLKQKNFLSAGFDISYSRIQYARHHLIEEDMNNSTLFVGDLFNIPIEDNSVDIVYTSHTLEPNGGKENEALEELYRITNKFLVLFEPMYEGASMKTKNHIKKHSYVKGLATKAESLGYKVIENKLLIDNDPYSDNNTGVLVIEKNGDRVQRKNKIKLACPITKAPMSIIKNNYYCNESMLLYPIVDGIPCLLPNNAIIATHFLDELG